MLQNVKFLLPTIIPSWRFFDKISHAPTLEFALLQTPQNTPVSWQEFRPRPARLSAMDMLKRIFWNAGWNESLFLVTCAERLMETYSEHVAHEIFSRIKADLKRNSVHAPFMQFRLLGRIREGQDIQKEIMFISAVYSL